MQDIYPNRLSLFPASFSCWHASSLMRAAVLQPLWSVW